jgi:Holliday junction resolvase RusA-like endonuclease
LDITPQTWQRVTQRDKIFFRIPEKDLRYDGLKRKRKLERFNDYKISVLALAKQKCFRLPYQGAAIKFYIPIPRTWPKWKKKLMHGKLHSSKPDLSNLLKAFEDSLFTEDKAIAHYSGLSKFWVDNTTGWIEISISDPVHEHIEFIPTKKPA